MDSFSVESSRSLCDSIFRNVHNSKSELRGLLNNIPNHENDDKSQQVFNLFTGVSDFEAEVRQLGLFIDNATTFSPSLRSELTQTLESVQSTLGPLGKQVMRLQLETLPLLNGLFVTAHCDVLAVYHQLFVFLRKVLFMKQVEDQEAALNGEEGRRLIEQASDAPKMIAKAGEILIDGHEPIPDYSFSSQGEASASKEKASTGTGVDDEPPPPAYEQAAAGPSSRPGGSSEGGGRFSSLKHSFKALTSGLFSKPDPLASALCEATRRGDIAQVEALLKQQGADADGRNHEGETPLTCAINAGQEAIAHVLIKAGAGQQHSSSSSPPLFLAAARGQLDVAQLLYDRGGASGNVRRENMLGQPYFVDVVGSGNIAGVRWLLDRGADPRAESVAGRSAVLQAAKKGSPEMVDVLLEHGAKVTSGDNCMLGISLDKADTQLMQVLIRHGAKLSSRTSDDERVLAAAIRKRKYAHAKCLLEAGAEANIEDENDVKVIVTVIKDGAVLPDDQVEMVSLLLRNGAKATSKDYLYRAPLNLAIERNLDSRIIGLLAQHIAEPDKTLSGGETPMTYSINTGRSDYVYALLVNGAHVNVPNKGGKTPLLLALMKKDLDLVRLLRQQYGAVLDDASREYALSKGQNSAEMRALDLDGGPGEEVSDQPSGSQDPPIDEMPPSYDAVAGGSSGAAEQPK